MENASKALLMAGGMLIALLIIGSIVILFSQLAENEQSENLSKQQEQVVKFNQQFLGYIGKFDTNNVTLTELRNKALTVNQLYSIYNKIHTNNTKYPEYTISSNILEGGNATTKSNSKNIYTYYIENFDKVSENHKIAKRFRIKTVEYNGEGGRINKMDFEDSTPDGAESLLKYEYD